MKIRERGLGGGGGLQDCWFVHVMVLIAGSLLLMKGNDGREWGVP